MAVPSSNQELLSGFLDKKYLNVIDGHTYEYYTLGENLRS